MKISVKRIVYLGLLVSIGIVLKMFKISVPFLGLSFTGFPIILSGILFGPISGGVVGGFVDIIGFILRPSGAFMPHFTITAMLTGSIPALVMLLFKNRELRIWHYLLAIGVGQLLTSVLLVPYFLNVLFSIPFKIRFYQGLITQSYHIPLYSYIIKVIVDRIKSLEVDFGGQLM